MVCAMAPINNGSLGAVDIRDCGIILYFLGGTKNNPARVLIEVQCYRQRQGIWLIDREPFYALRTTVSSN